MKSQIVYGSSGKLYKYPRISEQSIKLQILDWLKLKRIFHRRQNVVAMKKGKHFIRSGPKGIPDLWCVINGVYVGLEVKRPGGEQSRFQKDFEVEVTRAGGKYFIVHSLEEVIECLK